MNIQAITQVLVNNALFITVFFAVLFLIAFILIIRLSLDVSHMKKRYRKMMTGAEGENLERMLIGHVSEVKSVIEEHQRLDEEYKRISDLLNMAVTRVGIVRFRAFEDMGSDLSYAVALLNSHNDGVVLSSIFAREDSRSYGKPIVDGKSEYALSTEEEQALKEAMAAPVKTQ